MNPAAIQDTTIATLVVVMTVAVWTDIQERRVPNVLTLGGALLGIFLQALIFGPVGLLFGLAGWLVGLALLGPFYVTGGMGAGDVKLMALVGAFLGPGQAITAGVCVLLAGAIIGPVFVLAVNSMHALIAWIAKPALGGEASGTDAAEQERHKPQIPYAVAIAAGTFFAIWKAPLLESLWVGGL